MKDYTSEIPKFSKSIKILEVSDVGHADNAVAGEYAQQPPDHNGFGDKGGGYGGVPRGSGISCGRVLFVS